MNLDEIKEMWSSDCKIDDIELDKSSLEVPKLHSKYSDLLTENVMKVKGLEMQYHILLKDKWLWFNGKLDQDKLKSYGWEDDPFDGLKIMKNDFNYFFNSDKDLQAIKGQIEYRNITINYLKDCLENIKWRHQTIKNTIEWRKFMAGS
jgi:hypothetical protein